MNGAGGSLYWHGARVYRLVKELLNPDVLFLSEMTKAEKQTSEENRLLYPYTAIGINAADLAGNACSRNRDIRSNIPWAPLEESYPDNVVKSTSLQDVLDKRNRRLKRKPEDRRNAQNRTGKSQCLLKSKGLNQVTKVFKGDHGTDPLDLEIEEQELIMGLQEDDTRYSFGDEIMKKLERYWEREEEKKKGEEDLPFVIVEVRGDFSFTQKPAELSKKKRAEIIGNSVSVCMYKFCLWRLQEMFPDDDAVQNL